MADKRSLGKSDIKINNRILVLNLIKEHHAISRIQLSKITSMSPTSMTRIVNDLKELNLVCEVDTASNPLGRKATMIAINKDAFYALGISMMRTGIRMSLIDSTYTVLYTSVYEQEIKGCSSKELAESIYLKFPEFIFNAEESTSLELREDLSCIGISFPGMVDGSHKKIMTSPILGEDVKENFRKDLTRLFDLPVYVENDIKAALYSEYQRFGNKEEDTIAYLYLDIGIGAALMVGGEVYRGHSCGAGEIAYAQVSKSQTPEFFRDLSYLNLVEEANREGIRIEELTQLAEKAKEKDQRACQFLERIAERVSSVLNVINAFYNPSKIILGGSVIRDLPIVVSMASLRKENFYQALYPNLEIVISHEPTGGEGIGAAIVALDEYLKEKLKDKWY